MDFHNIGNLLCVAKEKVFIQDMVRTGVISLKLLLNKVQISDIENKPYALYIVHIFIAINYVINHFRLYNIISKLLNY